MKDIEEQLLHQNAGEVKQQTEAMPEMRIVQAMRTGIRKGKQQSLRKRVMSGLKVTVAAAAAVLMLYTFLDTPEKAVEYTVQNASPANTGTASGQFDASLIRDKTLLNALDQNLLRPVNKGVEKAGFKVEIKSAVSDGRQVFIVYSVRNNTDQTVIHADFGLEFGTFEAADIGATLEMLGTDNQIRAGQTLYFVYSNNLSPNMDYPEDVQYNVVLTQTSDEALSSSSNKYRTSLDVSFKLDTDMLKARNRLWTAKQDLTVAGQKLKVNQVLFTPLSTYVDVEAYERNTKQVNGLINPVLIGKSGDKIIKSYYPAVITADNSELWKDRSQFTLVYTSKDYLDLNSLSLKTFGIAAVDKNQMKIVVDLKKRRIVEAPDGFSIKAQGESAKPGVITFRNKREDIETQDSFMMRLAENYTDADGKMHTRLGGEGVFTQSLSRGAKTFDEEYDYNFGLQAFHYLQPLTVEIERYWNPMLDTQSVNLIPE
ncbi:DUF4179 domain-containing protein [Paenibacillus sp. DMB5]|uniref:DUF4179 domain-containing protein n=1 Tax=Paenibacillus sp. DMB5 TaxID=1780103 RepID=UPI00076CDD19|nr:DUF4179 domain-containing protein [Paenibacillus sp. DMB5]KUP24153.1 hypothetical protein AWJ19_11405 [Paenibacillus sp. DMB5]